MAYSNSPYLGNINFYESLERKGKEKELMYLFLQNQEEKQRNEKSLYIQKCLKCGRLETTTELQEQVIWQLQPESFTNCKNLSLLPESYKQLKELIQVTFPNRSFNVNLGIAHSICPQCKWSSGTTQNTKSEPTQDKPKLIPYCLNCDCITVEISDNQYKCPQCPLVFNLNNCNYLCPECNCKLTDRYTHLYCSFCNIAWEFSKKGKK